MVPAAKRAARWKERNAVIASPAAPLIRGRLTVRAAETPGDLARIMDLRSQVFRAGAEDGDAFDTQAVQVLVESGAAILAAFRLIPMDSGAGLATGYAAQSYDLSRLAAFPLPVLELGRFCTAPEAAAEGSRQEMGVVPCTAVPDLPLGTPRSQSCAVLAVSP